MVHKAGRFFFFLKPSSEKHLQLCGWQKAGCVCRMWTQQPGLASTETSRYCFGSVWTAWLMQWCIYQRLGQPSSQLKRGREAEREMHLWVADLVTRRWTGDQAWRHISDYSETAQTCYVVSFKRTTQNYFHSSFLSLSLSLCFSVWVFLPFFSASHVSVQTQTQLSQGWAPPASRTVHWDR